MKLLKKITIKPGSFNFKHILIGFLILLTISFVSYKIFFLESCDNQNCFLKALKTCRHVSWIKEDSDSAWKLIILRSNKRDSCYVNFKLLDIKKGTIESEKLIGKEMICDVIKTATNFPPDDIAQCNGPLKEGIQDIIIRKMHDYLVNNIGEVKEEFKVV